MPRYFGAGHTNGDSLVHFEHANIVHLGDLPSTAAIHLLTDRPGRISKNWITIMEKAQKKYMHLWARLIL